MMKNLKVLFVVAALFFGVGAAHAEQGQSAVGFNLGYAGGSHGVSNFGIGVKYDYYMSDNLRLQPSFMYYFDTDKMKMKDLSVDAQYLFTLQNEKVHPYVIFGATTLFGKERVIDDSYMRLGCNIGGGLQYDVTDDFAVVGEAKYKVCKDYGHLAICVGCVVTF